MEDIIAAHNIAIGGAATCQSWGEANQFQTGILRVKLFNLYMEIQRKAKPQIKTLISLHQIVSIESIHNAHNLW